MFTINGQRTLESYSVNDEARKISPPQSVRSSAEVAILLCSYNGEAYLEKQLESLVSQTHTDWVIYASDDGSTDSTLEVLHSYQRSLGADRLVILSGPRIGFAGNFMGLIRNRAIHADYYAFCDQDDIWYPDKLQRSLASLPSMPEGIPALYCSRTRLIDARGNPIGFSPLFRKKPAFANALVQSLAGANTMLFNEEARLLLAKTPQNAHVVSHDWLTYLLVSGCSGSIVYDPQPTLDYRQHGGNLIGSNATLGDRWMRIRKMLGGTFSDWNEYNLYAISVCCDQFSERNRKCLKRFSQARRASFLKRIYLLKKANIYRQTLLGNIGLVVAAGIGRI